MNFKHKKHLLAFYLSATLVYGNDSFYTKTKDEKILSEEENAVIVLLTSPKGHRVIVSDAGCMLIQLEIDDYILNTAQIPNLIEWRIDKKKKIIGVIIRTYLPIYNDKLGFEEGKYSSILNVLGFNDENETIFLGEAKTNEKAREVLDERE